MHYTFVPNLAKNILNSCKYNTIQYYNLKVIFIILSSAIVNTTNYDTKVLNYELCIVLSVIIILCLLCIRLLICL